jgi:hypothetical protein
MHSRVGIPRCCGATPHERPVDGRHGRSSRRRRGRPARSRFGVDRSPLLLGGLPIWAPIAHYGPFVMNTRDEILQAIEDYQAGRLGTIRVDQLVPRKFA